MCGIAGIISFYDSIDIFNLRKMTSIIKHRGPDDEGYALICKSGTLLAHGDDTITEIKNTTRYIGEVGQYIPDCFLGLGHRRLSILDLSFLGHQPMQDDTGTLYIVYNGEIYNYIEIRQELKNKGHKFFTNCDTEVILKAYKEWGRKCVNKFNGMWAFALWDSRKKILFCSRDRLGVKPFYYYYNEEKFLFASEVKQILEDNTVSRSPNEDAIFDYLVLRSRKHDGGTFFEKVHCLPGGCNLIVNLNKQNGCYANISIERYWCITDCYINLTYAESMHRLREELARSVKWRLRSDVAVGSCLSGGLDSSSIVSLACKFDNLEGMDLKQLQVFTACYDDEEVDERIYSEKVIRLYKCVEKQVYPSARALKNNIEKLIWHQDEPIGSPSMFAEWCVMEEVSRSGIKVLLGGQGSDEILFGYEPHYFFYFIEMLTKRNWKGFLKEFYFATINSGYNKKRLLLGTLYFLTSMALIFRLKKSAGSFLNNEFLCKKRDKFDEVKEHYKKIRNIKEYLLNDIYHGSLPNNLHSEDRNTMAFSIESRAPFVDYQLVEFCANLPYNYKIRNGWTKAILRDAMLDILPDEVRLRKKKLGFAAPDRKWLKELNIFVTQYLSSELKCGRYVDTNKIKEILRKDPTNRYIWNVFFLELWMNIFKVE